MSYTACAVNSSSRHLRICNRSCIPARRNRKIQHRGQATSSIENSERESEHVANCHPNAASRSSRSPLAAGISSITTLGSRYHSVYVGTRRRVLLLISVFYLTQARFRRESDLSSRNFCAFTPRLQLALLCTRVESVKTMSGTRSQRRNQRRFSVYVFRETVCPLSLFLSTQAVSPNKWDVVVRQTFRYTQYEAPDVAAMYDTRVPIRRGFARKEIARAKEPQLR